MGRADQYSSIFWLIFGSAVVYGSYQLGLGNLIHPGPGFLPFWCGVILIGLSALVFSQGKLAQRIEPGASPWDLWVGLKWPKPIGVTIALLTYAFTFTHVGFIVSTTFLLLFLFKAIETEIWRRAIMAALLASIICYSVFAVWLQVQLPRGYLEGLLF